MEHSSDALAISEEISHKITPCWTLLPTELLINIFEYLNDSQLVTAAQVCRTFRDIAYDDRVWRSLCARKYKCQQFPSAKLQQDASLRALSMSHLPFGLSPRLSAESLQIIKQAGVIYTDMKEHYQYIKQAASTKSFMHKSIFIASVEKTFGYQVHSSPDLVGRELIAAVEHSVCEWSINLMERVIDHSRIPTNWKAILLCKIYWTCCIPENSEIWSRHDLDFSNYCIEADGLLKLNFLLEKAINHNSWSNTSELIVDTLLLLGASTTRSAIKRGLTASCKTPSAFDNFRVIFPKLVLSLEYTCSSFDLSSPTDELVYLASALERCEIEYGPEGDIFYSIHIAALNKNIDVLNYLVDECGVDINQPTANGNTPLSLVFASPNTQTHSDSHSTTNNNGYYIKDSNANTNNSSSSCSNHYSASNGSSNSVSDLAMETAMICLSHGAELTSIVLRSACQGGYWDFVHEILDQHALDPCIYYLDASNQIQTPLQKALEAHRIDIALLFLHRGGQIVNITHFKWITEPDSLDFFHCSLDLGFNWSEIMDSKGNTLLHYAASVVDSINIEFLLKIVQHIPKTIVNHAGNTPIELLIDSMTETTRLSHLLVFLLANVDSLLQDDVSVSDELTEDTIVRLFQEQIRSGVIQGTSVLMITIPQSGTSLLSQCLALKRSDLLTLFVDAGGSETKQISQLLAFHSLSPTNGNESGC